MHPLRFFRRFVLLLLAIASAAASVAAESAGPAEPAGLTGKYWIRFADKGPASSNMPGTRSWEDLPLHAPYVAALEARGARVLSRLKWQNRVSVLVPDASLPLLRASPGVRSVEAFLRKVPLLLPAPDPFGPWSPAPLAKAAAPEDRRYGASLPLLDSLGILRVHRWMEKRGTAPGRGIRLAVIDTDFKLGHGAFRTLMAEGRVKDRWDFVKGESGGVSLDTGASHGAQCMSLIGGNLPDTLMGAAPWADFLLYRAEDGSQERYIEEDFVAAAIERAVDSGAQVISISLGYRDGFSDGSPDYPFAWLDGRTRPSSLAALGAARRDVLVVTSVGNADSLAPYTGPTLGAPADADSILAVGMVGSEREHCNYSCTGPTADGRIKPDISSMGPMPGCKVWAAQSASTRIVYTGSGTSFAAPLIAGIAALVRQARPGLSAMEARQAILSSGDHAGRPDSLVGFGLADAWRAVHGPGAVPPPNRGRVSAAFHPGGRTPLSIAWGVGEGTREVRVVDADGRRIRVTLRQSGARLFLDPVSDLRTGVYFVRVKP